MYTCVEMVVRVVMPITDHITIYELVAVPVKIEMLCYIETITKNTDHK